MKTIGKVTEQERDEIRALFERQNGLAELVGVIAGTKNNELYEQVVTDMGATKVKFDTWWSSMADKYNWESSPNGCWSVNFDTCDIYLEEK